MEKKGTNECIFNSIWQHETSLLVIIESFLLGIKARKISQNLNIAERKQSNDEDWARFSVHSAQGGSNSELSNSVPPDEFQASAGLV